MAMDVCQTFLHHPKDCKLHIRWKSPEIIWDAEIDGYATSFNDALYVPLQRRRKPRLIQQWRVQQVRGRAYFAIQLLRQLLNSFQFACHCGSNAVCLVNYLRELHAKDRQRLTSTVMQVTSNAPPLFVLDC
jgi:hypothetical protein